jgi:serine/threonine protein kinase
MLKKDPKIRISAKEALMHPWFNQNEDEINTKSLDFAKEIEEDDDFP